MSIFIGGNLNLVNGTLSYNPSDIDTVHTEGSHIQLYTNGAFPKSEIETIGLTRRPSTANLFITIHPVRKLSFLAISRWVGPHTDIFYDTDLGPFGALNSIALEDYVLFDLLINYELGNHFSVSLKGENILDTQFINLRGFTARGRGMYLTIKGTL